MGSSLTLSILSCFLEAGCGMCFPFHTHGLFMSVRRKEEEEVLQLRYLLFDV